MLELQDVHTYYGESYVLQGITMAIKDGSVVSLLGRNGMGKTTTIRTIIGFTPPRRGTITFQGKSLIGLQPHQIAQLGIGLVPQGRRIFSCLSVAENLTMAARSRGRGSAWTLDKIYALFPRLKERAKNKANLLSGGEQQMLTIARALMTNPDLLLLDEPSEGLAPILVWEVGQVIGELKKQGFSILLVEQNLSMALRVADHVYIMSKGKIVYESTPIKLKGDDETKAKYLGVTG